MKAVKCSRMWRPAAGVMLVGALTFAVTAQGGPRVADGTARTKSETARQVTGPADQINTVVAGAADPISFQALPKASHPGGPYNHGGCYAASDISGNTLTLDAGNCRTYWNMFMSSWDPAGAPTGREMRGWQFRIDSAGYVNRRCLAGSAANVGMACTTDADCGGTVDGCDDGGGDPITTPAVACTTSGNCATAFGETGAICDGGVVCNFSWINSGRTDPKWRSNLDPPDCNPATWNTTDDSPTGPFWLGATEPPPCPLADPQVPIFIGAMALDVPAGAKGTYVLPFVQSETFADDENLVGFVEDPALMIPGRVVIPTGACCFGLGGVAPGCADNHTAGSCAALAQPSIFTPGAECLNPPTDDGCCECLSDAQCNDNDACTTDRCSNCVCSHNPIPAWSPATQCCNAADGAVCTPTVTGTCESAACSLPDNRGVCVNTPFAAGAPCSGDDNGAGQTDGDSNPCTYNDVCDGASADGCAGTDINGENIACTVDQDCLDATGASAATCVSGVCNCTLIPDLTVDIDESGKEDPNCFNSGTKVTATVHVAAATAPINGGQFLIIYDPSCLDLNENGVNGVAPYTDKVYEVIDEGAGTIFTVVGVGFGANPQGPNAVGPAGNADMLSLSFTKKGECNSCQICFGSNNPQNTYLVDNTGQRVAVNPVCSKPVVGNNALAIDGPGNIKTNVDCDQPAATVSWDPPTVSDTCGNATMTCTGEYQDGTDVTTFPVPVDPMTGGKLPAGYTNFCCNATSDWCDKTAEHCWTVDVNEEIGLDITIGLSPTQQSKPADDLTRCIKFTCYSSSVQNPFSWEEDITFGGLFDYVGKSKDSLKIPTAMQCDCISAWDQLHTLRACYNVDLDDCVDGRIQASFRGDPLFGGNWLIGGNLDGWKKDLDGSAPSLFVIDILDYGTFVSQWGADYGSGDTPCGTPGPNADINGDGSVTMEDFAFISMNFLASAKICCGAALPASGLNPITEISVRELREMGLGDLTAGDVNGDGLLNVDDMTSFMQGSRPEGKGVRGVRKGSGTR